MDELAEKRKMKVKKIAIVVLAGAAAAAFFHFELHRYLTLDALKANRQVLLDLYARHRVAMVAAFMGVYVLQTALSLPGAAVMSLAAGALFGPFEGTLYAVLSAAVGATLACAVVRYLLRDAVMKKFAGKLEGVNRELEERGLSYLLFLRLIPAFPFFLINLAAGLTRLPLRTFFLGTFIGIVPGGFVYVNAGASLATITSLSDVISVRVLGAFALLGLFALLPVVASRMRKGR